MTISGRLVTGQGQGASFTRLPWARDQFLARLGIDPYPGTLNLVLDEADSRAGRDALRARPGELIQPPEPDFCAARCYPVRLEAWLPGGIVLPDVPGYPEGQVEVISALPVRETLSCSDGDRISLEVCDPLRVRAVIFDVDGTLVDSLEAFRVVAACVAEPRGLEVTDALVKQSLTSGRPFWELVVTGEQANGPEMIRQLQEEALRLWPDVLRRHARAVPGLRAMLDALQRRNTRLGLATGSDEPSFEPLRREDLMGYFAAVVTGEDVERRKPDPEGLLKCAAALGVAPREALYVGDTPLDVEAANAAGMAAVAVLTGAGDSALLSRSGPDRIVASVALLPELLEAP